MSIFSKNREVRVGRSAFNLSYSKLLTMDMGQLIPIMCDEVVPGDVFDIGNEMVIRFQPLVAPVLHPISAYVHYFFVPYRLLWDSWENFITEELMDRMCPFCRYGTRRRTRKEACGIISASRQV